jgi:hypothetical protein
MSGESIQKIFEGEREEDDEGWIDRFNNLKIYDEGEGEHNHDEQKVPSSQHHAHGLKQILN